MGGVAANRDARGDGMRARLQMRQDTDFRFFCPSNRRNDGVFYTGFAG